MSEIKRIVKGQNHHFLLFYFSCFLAVIIDLAASIGISLLLGLLTSENHDLFQPAITISLALALLPALLMLICARIDIPFAQDSMIRIRKSLFERIISLRYHSFLKASKDEYLSYLTCDLSNFQDSYFTALKGLVTSTSLFVAALFIVAYLDLLAALIIAVFVGAISVISWLFKKKAVKLSLKLSTINAAYSLKISNLVEGFETIKSYEAEDSFFARAKDLIEKKELVSQKYTFVTQVQSILSSKLGLFATVLMLIYMLYALSIGKATFPVAVIIVIMTNLCAQNISSYLSHYTNYKSSSAIIDKRFFALSTEKDETENTNAHAFVMHNKIEAEDLSFGYQGNDILKHVSFSINKGEKCLICGPSGAGKTTLLNLLDHTIEDYQGSILFDGISLKKIDIKSFNTNISIISQDVFLFEDTILNNICLYKAYDELAVSQAISQAGLTDFVQNLPDGIKTSIGENGKNLSAGQRQRIAIARAIIRGSKLVFADEVTANLPPDKALEIEKVLLSLEATVISVAHHSYAEDRYNKVLYLENGHVETVVSIKEAKKTSPCCCE